MKKLFALFLLALPMVFAMTSCSDDDDLPNVSMSIDVDNAVHVGEDIYLVQGDTLKITGINITNNESGKGATIYRAQFRFANIMSYDQVVQPFQFYLPTSDNPDNGDYIPVGNYPLDVYCNIAAEDKTLAIAVLSYTVCVVASADDIPSDAVSGTLPSNIDGISAGQMSN